MEPPNQKTGAGRSLEIAAITGGGPEAAGELVGLSFGLADGAALDVSIPVFLIPKLQMFLQHVTAAAAAKRAQLPAEFQVTEVVQPFTLAGSVTIRPTDQGPFLVISQTQEGLPIDIAIPREGRGLGKGSFVGAGNQPGESATALALGRRSRADLTSRRLIWRGLMPPEPRPHLQSEAATQSVLR